MPVSDSMVVGGAILPTNEFDESAGIYEDFSRGLSVIGTDSTPMNRDGVFKNGQYSHGCGLPWAKSPTGSHYQANGERQYYPSPFHSFDPNPLSQFEIRNGNLVIHARRTTPTEQEQFANFKGYYIDRGTGQHAKKSYFTSANGFPSGPPQSWGPVSEGDVWRFNKMPAGFISGSLSLMGRYEQSHGRVMTRGTVASGASYLSNGSASVTGRNYQQLEAWFAAVVWALEAIEFGKNMNGEAMLNADGSVRMFEGYPETDLAGNVLDGGGQPEFDGAENFSRSTNYTFGNVHYHNINSTTPITNSTPGIESPTADCRNNLYTYGYDYTPEKIGFFVNDKYFAVIATPSTLANPKPYFVIDPQNPYQAIVDQNGKALTDGIRKHSDGSDFWTRFSWITNLAAGGKVAIDQSFLGLLNSPESVGDFTGIAEQHIEYMAMFPLLDTPDQNPVVKYNTEVLGGSAPTIPAFFTRPDKGGAINPARGNYTLSTATYLGDEVGDDVVVPDPPTPGPSGPFLLQFDGQYLVWEPQGSTQFDIKLNGNDGYVTTVFGAPYQWEPLVEGSYSITAIVNGVGVNSDPVVVSAALSTRFSLTYNGTNLTWDPEGFSKFSVNLGSYDQQTRVATVSAAPYSFTPTVDGTYFLTAATFGATASSDIVTVVAGTPADPTAPFELGFDGQFLVWDPRGSTVFSVLKGTLQNSVRVVTISQLPYRYEPVSDGTYYVASSVNGVSVQSNVVSVGVVVVPDLNAFDLTFDGEFLRWDRDGYNVFTVATGDPNGSYEPVNVLTGVAGIFKPTYSGDYFVYTIHSVSGARINSAVVNVNLGDSNFYDFSELIGLAPGSTMRIRFDAEGVETVLGINLDTQELANYHIDMDAYHERLYEKWRVDALYRGLLPDPPSLPDNPTARETSDYNKSLFAYAIAVYNAQIFHSGVLEDLGLDDHVPFDTFYFETLYNFAMHYCYSVDDDVTANSGRAQKHWYQALQLANVQEKGSESVESAQIEDDR